MRLDQIVAEELALRESIALREEIANCEKSLRVFFRTAWPYFDSSPFMNNWHLDAIADHLQAVSEGKIKRLLINIPPRHGKACAHDTPVLTPAGWTTHGELRVGDYVFGPDGQPAQVIALSPEVDEVVPVELTNGEVIRCHPNHEWTVLDRSMRSVRTMETRAIAATQYWSGDRARFQLPLCAPAQFPDASLPIHPYVLGVWLGDGSSKQARIAYAAADAAVVAAVFAHGYTISSHRVHPDTGVHYADLRSGFYSSLRTNGLLGNKHIPEVYLRASYEQRLQLLAGLIDTDGHVEPQTGRVRISTVSELLRDGIVDLVTTLGMRPYVSVAKPDQRERKISGSQAVFQVGFQSTAPIPTVLPRKRITVFAPQRAVGIRSIGPIEKAPARSIQVDRPDGLYLVGRKLNPTHNTNMVAIAWPIWTWIQPPDPATPLKGPGVKFLCASYGASKAEADGVTARRLISHEWFVRRWGDRVQIAKDRDNQGQYDTTIGGYRICTGIPESLGKGGAVRVLDDPHKTDDVESDLVRTAQVRAYDEIWRTRSNDPLNGAEVIIMQRLAEGDISGHVLEESDPQLVHLMLPMEYDPRRHCTTVLGFSDPRREEGELLWPDRFTDRWVINQKKRMGPHAFAGQFNQIPTARGGGIIQQDWWKLWPPEGQEDSWTSVDPEGATRMLYPDLDYVLVSCDTAYTEKEENDWSACTVWGVFQDDGRNPRVILLEAWRERLELRALSHKILSTCRRRRADALVVEAKASGLSVLQEIRRLMRDGEFTIFAEIPKGDKIARLHAVSPAFSAGLVFAPNRKWADMVISEVSSFPRSRWKDLTDTVSAGIKKLRDLGLLKHTDEAAEDRDTEEWSLGTAAFRRSVREEYGV